ncbi:Ima1 N-terminal domain-containing protein [Syncephalis plumigaleata]|nr:Ima1 N-terminal domain-containing protein [Syncephalis plumigaleata]
MFTLFSPIVLVFGTILILWILYTLYGEIRNRLLRRGQAVQCFYCHQWTRLPPVVRVSPSDETNATTGQPAQHRHIGETPYNWFCQYCQNRNLRAKNGELIDQVPAMFDESLNATQWRKEEQSTGNQHHQHRQRRRRCQGLSDTELMSDDEELSVPFCDSCLFNHNMVLQLLTSYQPDESDPNFKDYDTAVEAYKAKIEERYPPLCEQCAPRVQRRITQTNTRIRARYYGEALRRSKTTPFVNHLPRYRWWKAWLWLWIFGMEWISRGLTFYMCWSGHTNVKEPVVVLWEPFDQLFRFRLSWTANLPNNSLYLIVGIASLTIVWDPTWLRRVYKRQRVYPRGLTYYRLCQIGLSAIRLGLLGLSEEFLPSTYGILLIGLSWMCTPTPPTPIRLCDKPTSKVYRAKVQPLYGRKRSKHTRVQQPMSGESDYAVSPPTTPPDSPRKSVKTRRRDPNALVFSDDDDDTLCDDTRYSVSLGTMLQNMNLGTPRARRSHDADNPAIDTTAVTTTEKEESRRTYNSRRRRKTRPEVMTNRKETKRGDADDMDWAPTTPHAHRQRIYHDLQPVKLHLGSVASADGAANTTGASGLFRVPPSFDAQNRFGQTYLTEVMQQQQQQSRHHDSRNDNGITEQPLVIDNNQETGLEQMFQRSFQIRDNSSIAARLKHWFSG